MSLRERWAVLVARFLLLTTRAVVEVGSLQLVILAVLYARGEELTPLTIGLLAVGAIFNYASLQYAGALLIRSRIIEKMALRWKYRHIDPDLCCCGESLSREGRHNDSICQQGGCRSMREYAIQQELHAGNPAYSPYANRSEP